MNKFTFKCSPALKVIIDHKFAGPIQICKCYVNREKWLLESFVFVGDMLIGKMSFGRRMKAYFTFLQIVTKMRFAKKKS